MFKRNSKFDEIIVKAKSNPNILDRMDYFELTNFVNYLIELNANLIKGE